MDANLLLGLGQRGNECIVKAQAFCARQAGLQARPHIHLAAGKAGLKPLADHGFGRPQLVG